jgi:hypothetical protein
MTCLSVMYASAFEGGIREIGTATPGRSHISVSEVKAD